MLEIFEKLVGDKKEYRDMMARVKRLPEDYQFVYGKIQKYMWNYATGSGLDMLRVQYNLIELFEIGAADGKQVLEITGEDVATFSDELLKSAKTYTEKHREALSHEKVSKKEVISI